MGRTYTTYKFKQPTGTYKDYMPKYTTYQYTKPKEKFDPSDTTYGDAIFQAQAKLNALERSKPAAYKSAYNDRIDQLINQIGSRKFTYDVNNDAIYNQYKDRYTAQAQQAMADTMGQAAALTGGYGNSYAASVGQQAYQRYMDDLNNRIPELYQLALDRYNAEGNELQNMYGMLSERDALDYAKYRDTVADWQTDRGYYDSRYQNLMGLAQNLYGQNWSNYLNTQQMNDANYQAALNFAQNRLAQDWANYQWGEEQSLANRAQAVAEEQSNRDFNYQKNKDDRDYNYQVSRDKVADDQWSKSFDYQKAKDDRDYTYQRDRDRVADDQWLKNFNEGVRQFNANYDYEKAKDDRNYNYQVSRDNAADAQNAASLALQRAQLAENSRQFDASQAESKRQFDASQKTSSSGYSQNYSNVRNQIVSQADFNKNRRLSNSYPSYKDYVKSVIDGAEGLTDAEIAQLIIDYKLY